YIDLILAYRAKYGTSRATTVSTVTADSPNRPANTRTAHGPRYNPERERRSSTAHCLLITHSRTTSTGTRSLPAARCTRGARDSRANAHRCRRPPATTGVDRNTSPAAGANTKRATDTGPRRPTARVRPRGARRGRGTTCR